MLPLQLGWPVGVRKQIDTRGIQSTGDRIERRPVIVISGNRENPDLGIEPRQRMAEGADIAPHRVRPGKIIASEKNELGFLAIDHINRKLEAFDVLIHVQMEIAYLAGDD